MVEIRARSRSPARSPPRGIDSKSFLASSRLQTGVLPRLTTYFGPRTDAVGFTGTSCRPRVFISYARKDGEAFASNLRQRLQEEEPEITLWQDRAELEGGVGWW